jgi:outer membrane lipoprotein-sorting protein
MFRKIFFLMTIILFASSLYAQTADEILSKMEEAYGGKKAYDDIKTMKVSASVEGMRGEAIANLISVDTSKFLLTVPSKKVSICIHGKESWMDKGDGKVQDIPEEQIWDIKQMINLQIPLFTKDVFDIRKDSNKLEFLGKEKVDEYTCYKLKLIDKEEKESNLFIDTKTNYAVKYSAIQDMGGQEANLEVLISDNKKINGVVFPYKIEIKINETTMQTVKFEKIELNVPVDEKIFAKPESKPEPTKPEIKK